MIFLNLIYYDENEFNTIGCHVEYYKNVLFKYFTCNIKFGYKNINPKLNNIFIIWRNWNIFNNIAKIYNKTASEYMSSMSMGMVLLNIDVVVCEPRRYSLSVDDRVLHGPQSP